VRVPFFLVVLAALAGCGGESPAPLVTEDAPKCDEGKCVVDGPYAPPTQKTWLVRPGDSLRRIARQVYGDENLWKAIRDANAGKVGRDGAIAVGVVLSVPFDGI
jgi:nucleoid-associated protein YgaU